MDEIELVGSEKQIAWARDVRARLALEIAKRMAELERRAADPRGLLDGGQHQGLRRKL